MNNDTLTETAKPRLIDANALLEELRSYGYDETSNAVFLAETATTVETTDVANKFFVEFMQSQNPGEQLMSAGTAGRFIEYVQKKKFEESLKQK